VATRTDSLELGPLQLSSGEGRSLELTVPVDSLQFGGERYEVDHGRTDVRLDVSRTTGSGYSLRLRFGIVLRGPCTRCLEDAGARVDVESREVDQPGGGDEMRSPYLEDDELDLRAWVRDALALALPTQIVCGDSCAGLCSVCGANLNDEPDHAHERAPDPRWAKLSELKLD
jgi:uncharacterized protein